MIHCQILLERVEVSAEPEGHDRTRLRGAAEIVHDDRVAGGRKGERLIELDVPLGSGLDRDRPTIAEESRLRQITEQGRHLTRGAGE
ncbi:hypothetical protein EB118_24160, partial [bacterium]|nr:hypothetical protein [bacterium]